MKVLTKLQQAELEKQHDASLKWSYSTESAKVVAKLHYADTGAVWYAFEGSQCEDGWQLYCYADSGGCGDYAYEYLTIPDLCATGITRDNTYVPETVSDTVLRLTNPATRHVWRRV